MHQQCQRTQQLWWKATQGWKDYRSGEQSAIFKYCSTCGLQGKWKQCWLLWSITKCLPGICLFNPLSEAIRDCSMDRRPEPHRKTWMIGEGHMWARHTHRLTQPCSRAETHAQVLLIRTLTIVQRTAECTTYSVHTNTCCFCYKWADEIKKQKNSTGKQFQSHKRSFTLCKRQTEKNR